ncbi:MAG TPA: MFS transporter [Thermoleophilaceae bacterium]|nr:MFS transporter [Thermoleophilaceae bacterium]
MRTNALRLPVAGAAFLALADTAIVALALPPILLELDTDVAGVAAVLGVYAVVLALALPVAERLREAVGTRPVGLAGVALFAGGSLACGLADTLNVLLLARAVQALGGAALLVTAYALLAGQSSSPSPQLWRLAALLGTAAGPAIGGALTQAFGWRSIFLFQAPAALAALPGALAADDLPELRSTRRRGRRRSLAERGGLGRPAAVERPRWALGRALALGLVSGAIAAALFLVVLLLITGWGIEPLTAALAVSVMPLAALAATRIGGPPPVLAAGGALLVAAGTAALAFVPTASVAWTIAPQLAVGVGMGMALPALTGQVLPERSGRDAALLLSVRHAGIALALLILAPIAQNELDATLDQTRERGAAIILDAEIDPQVKLDIAPRLSESVETEDPRGGLRGVFSAARGDVDDDQLAAYDALTERADEVLVSGVNEGFSTAFLVGAALALLAALLLLPAALGYSLAGLRPAFAAGALAVAALGVGAYALLADRDRPAQVVIADPCQDRDTPDTGGLTGFLQDAALVALDRVACEAGSSREELVLALLDDSAAREYKARYDVDPRSLGDLAESVLPG